MSGANLRLEFIGEPSLSAVVPIPEELRREPFQSIYVVMTEVLEDAGSAQARGEIAAAQAFAEEASVLGRAIGILAKRATLRSDEEG